MATDAPDTGSQRFPCNTCGAELLYDPASTALVCGSCGRTEAIPSSFQEIHEHPFAESLGDPEPARHEPAARSLRCKQCGAVTMFATHVVATSCPFCGSHHVFDETSTVRLLRPESLIPFQVTRQEAAARFRAWLGSLWLRPNDLRKKGALGEIRGLYLPFWAFSAAADSSWSAQSGRHYTTEEKVVVVQGGREIEQTRTVVHTKWKHVSGRHFRHYREVFVIASAGLAQQDVDRIAPFDFTGLVPHRVEYLSGFDAERYALDVTEGWACARSILRDRIRANIATSIEGDTHKDLSVQTYFLNIAFKHALLPIYVAPYTYRRKVYRYLVNGQTGKASGQAPLSVFKVGALILLLAALVWLLVRYCNPELPEPVPPGAAAAVRTTASR